MFSGLSIRTRLTGLFVIIFGSTLVLFAALTYQYLSNSLLKEFDDALYNYAVDVSDGVSLNSAGDLTMMSADVDQAKIYPFSLGTALVQIRFISGNVIAQLGNFGDFHFPFKEDFEKLTAGEEVTFRTVSKLDGLPDAEAHSYRLINFPLDDASHPQLILQIAVPLNFIEVQMLNRRRIFETGIPLVLLIATLAGFFLSSRALAPVQPMIQNARAIGAEGLSTRLPVPAANDEVRSLAQTLNQMLSRIEQAFQSQERFVADASHQLLTPLTIMRGEIEQTLKMGKLEPAVFESSLQEVDHLIALVKNLLLLAQVDAGVSAMSLTDLYLDEIVLDSISRTEKLARAKDIRLKFDIQNQSGNEDVRPKIRGDEDLIQNLIFNLIENAIKYSSKTSVVKITLTWRLEEQILEVEDSGLGIPDSDLENIFDRFSRAQNVSKKIQGYGLGLAIAKKIAEVHGTELTAENHQTGQGAKFQLRIKNI
jgi:signal transduction histidine kinase